jgi:hypothetical protein
VHQEKGIFVCIGAHIGIALATLLVTVILVWAYWPSFVMCMTAAID